MARNGEPVSRDLHPYSTKWNTLPLFSPEHAIAYLLQIPLGEQLPGFVWLLTIAIRMLP